MLTIAERYVRLVLAVGQHDRDYVDAYYGPPAWIPDPRVPPPSLEHLRGQAARLLDELAAHAQSHAPVSAAPIDDMERLRETYLQRQLCAVDARLRMLQGERLSFDEESQALYDAVAPVHGEDYFAATLKALDQRVPGDGPLIGRYERYKQAFVIPPDRLDAVFTAAIVECRRRTAQHLAMPGGERFSIEYVTGRSWSGYNWFQGDAASLIQVNTDLPIYIDRAIDLAAHEGYPGHHVYNALIEEQLVRQRGWLEFSVYALFSPQSLIAEGTANFGIEVAFPGPERAAFERDVLYPLAGLDAARAEEYVGVMELVARLAYAGNEAARRYLDGSCTAEEAAAWLEHYALMPRARADQRVRFFDQYRSYVINYNVGQDMVRTYIERRGGTAADPDRRWSEFAALLTSPRVPSALI